MMQKAPDSAFVAADDFANPQKLSEYLTAHMRKDEYKK